MMFNPLNHYAHKRPHPDRISSIAEMLSKPAYGLSDEAEDFRSAALLLLGLVASLEDEILNSRHLNGFRDKANLDINDWHHDMYRASSGNNWVARGRGL